MSQKTVAESLPPVLAVLARERGAYTPRRPWGSFDSLGLRAVDDLFFAPELDGKTLYAFTSEPPHAAGVTSVAIPTQLVLERFFFHLAEPTVLMLNQPVISSDAPIPQAELAYTLPKGFEAPIKILKADVPELLGALSVDAKALRTPLASAEKALRKGELFESFFLAREAKRQDAKDASMAGFCELYAYSFFGAPEDALALYDEYPDRGSPEPHAQLLAARYRLLLKQFNEARTILHTLSFHERFGALALCELARSYVIERDFARALDLAVAAIEKDRDYLESYLMRGLAYRGISYDAGEAEGLKDAFQDCERVAKQGGYSAAEASYHAGTVCARLGVLDQAELAFRQSLFQRDRVSARDAFIRVLCAREKRVEAIEEFQRLEQILPHYATTLKGQLGKALELDEQSGAASDQSPRGDDAGLWIEPVEKAVSAARSMLAGWGVPLTNTLSDCALLDEFVNRFAPDGDFPPEGKFSELRVTGVPTVARALALHLGALLVGHNAASWGPSLADSISIVSATEGVAVPIEHFVNERILLGASGDNFSSLESLVMETRARVDAAQAPAPADWWQVMSGPVEEKFQSDVEWVADILGKLGAQLRGKLSDLDEVDRIFDVAFEPGGNVKSEEPLITRETIDRFIIATGVMLGLIISKYIHTEWATHEKPEGISFFNKDLGRIFPVAKVQRRAYLASAADFGSKLGSLAWSVAAASVTEGIREGRYVDADQVRAALVERLPQIEQFPAAELAGVVDSLLIGATLR